MVQQRAGRVARGGVDPDTRLEREAHKTGLAAARGEVVHLPGAAAAPAAEGAAPVQRTGKKLKRLLRYLGLMAPAGGAGGGGGGAAAAGGDLDDFVAAYDNARYYHGTEEKANARSIHQHGLLTHTDRAATLGGEVSGMSATRRDFHGDEKRGVYFGDRYFMEDEDVTIPKNRVRLFMSHDRMDDILPPTRIHNAPADAIVRDPNWGGALISKSSIPADRTYYGDMTDLATNPDDRLTSILSAVASYPEGQTPSEAPDDRPAPRGDPNAAPVRQRHGHRASRPRPAAPRNRNA